MDPSKVQAIHDWPVLQSARAVHSFLRLACYYHKFVDGYGVVATPLIALLKKEGFSWGDEVAATFTTLKVMVTSVPILAMLDLTKTFVVERDASS